MTRGNFQIPTRKAWEVLPSLYQPRKTEVQAWDLASWLVPPLAFPSLFSLCAHARVSSLTLPLPFPHATQWLTLRETIRLQNTKFELVNPGALITNVFEFLSWVELKKAQVWWHMPEHLTLRRLQQGVRVGLGTRRACYQKRVGGSRKKEEWEERENKRKAIVKSSVIGLLSIT